MPKDASLPQARHHFTQVDQMGLLVGSSEATPDIGYIGWQLMLLQARTALGT